jgi:hypothetical protein
MGRDDHGIQPCQRGGVTPSRLVCASCGWEPGVGAAAPFRCANSGSDDGDHVLAHRLATGSVLDHGDDENPFVRYRECLYAWHAARARGMSDAAFVELVRRLDDGIAAVDGRGFRTTPFRREAGLDVPQQGAGKQSRQRRRLAQGTPLMGILLHLAVTSTGQRVAGC